jgi:hypothetical protein
MATWPEPTWTSSENRDQPVSVFEDQPVSLVSLSSLLVRLLQYHFMSANHVFNPALRSLIWTEDETTSKIFVGAGYAQNDKVASQKPGIFVRRADVKTTKAYLDPEVAQVTTGGQAAPEFPVYYRLLEGRHIVDCVSKSGAEAEVLGEEVFRRLLAFGPAIREDAGLRMFDLLQMTEVARKENGSFVTEIVLIWADDFYFKVPEERAW